MIVLGWRLFSFRISPVFSPNLPAMALMVSPRAMEYSAGGAGCAGLKAAGMVVETDDAGMTAAVAWAACAFMAAARVAGTGRAGCWAAAGCARARDDNTTAGSAAVVAAIKGRLGFGGCFGERDIVMGRNPLLNCGRGRGCR